MVMSYSKAIWFKSGKSSILMIGINLNAQMFNCLQDNFMSFFTFDVLFWCIFGIFVGSTLDSVLLEWLTVNPDQGYPDQTANICCFNQCVSLATRDSVVQRVHRKGKSNIFLFSTSSYHAYLHANPINRNEPLSAY